ncbi:MAG: hypothetical protein ACTSXW_03535 [Candidatus Baldrarchaeia archaeon]
MSFKRKKDKENNKDKDKDEEMEKMKKPFTFGFSIKIGPEGIKIKRHTPKGSEDLPLPPFPVLPLFPKFPQPRRKFKQKGKLAQEFPCILSPMDFQTDGENILLIYNIQSENINVEASSNSLIIKAGDQVFVSLIPVSLDLNSLRASYKNGILEISGKIDKKQFKKIL